MGPCTDVNTVNTQFPFGVTFLSFISLFLALFIFFSTSSVTPPTPQPPLPATSSRSREGTKLERERERERKIVETDSNYDQNGGKTMT